MIEYLLAEITYHRLADLFKKICVDVVGDAFKEKNNDDNYRQQFQEKQVLLHKDLVKQIFYQICLGTGECSDEDHRYHGNYEFASIWTDFPI